jgi:hypothetical protein
MPSCVSCFSFQTELRHQLTQARPYLARCSSLPLFFLSISGFTSIIVSVSISLPSFVLLVVGTGPVHLWSVDTEHRLDTCRYSMFFSPSAPGRSHHLSFEPVLCHLETSVRATIMCDVVLYVSSFVQQIWRGCTHFELSQF